MADRLKLKQRLASFFGYLVAGVSYVVVAGLVLFGLASAVQLGADINTITSLLQAFRSFDMVAIGIGLFSFAVLGFLIWVFGIIGVAIRKQFGSKEEEIKFNKRPALAGFFLAGVIAVVIFAGLEAILAGLVDDPNVKLTDINTLFDAILEVNIGLLIAVFIGMAGIGFLVIKIARYEKPLSEKLPEQVQVI